MKEEEIIKRIVEWAIKTGDLIVISEISLILEKSGSYPDEVERLRKVHGDLMEKMREEMEKI